MSVDAHIHCRQVHEVTDDISFGQLRKGRGNVGQCGVRDQFRQWLFRDVAAWKDSSSTAVIVWQVGFAWDNARDQFERVSNANCFQIRWENLTGLIPEIEIGQQREVAASYFFKD
jgi:hypothetical protein